MAESLVEKVRSEVGLTDEWKELQYCISTDVRKALERKESIGHDVLVKNITASLKSKVVYHNLQVKVAGVVEGQLPKGNKRNQDQALEAAILLLQRRPTLKSHLKVFINVPFPLPLRKMAWGVFLQSNEPIKKECMSLLQDDGKTKREFEVEDQELFKACTRILQSDKLTEFKKKSNLVLEFYFVLNFWKVKTKNDMTMCDFLICLPFLHLFKDELMTSTSSDNKTTNWPVVATVAEMYFTFMHMMPLSMRSVLYEKQHREALNTLCETIETILTEIDLELAQHLNRILSTRNKKEQKIGTKPFSYYLGHLIHPFLQRIFVGILSLEVVSFVIDQCFVVLEIPGCSFMPYFVVSWLSLLQKKIISCRKAENIKEVLEKNSSALTVLDFQLEIKKKLLHKIMDKKLMSFTFEKDTEELSVSDSETEENSEKELAKLEKNADTVHTKQILLQAENFNIGETTKPQKDDTTNELVKQLATIKQELAEKDEAIAELRQQQLMLTNELLHKQRAERSSNDDKRTPIPIIVHQTVSELPDTLPALSNTTNSTKITDKKYDPFNLSEADVKEIWLTIMTKFTSAKYLVCHGAGEEKQKLMQSVSEHL